MYMTKRNINVSEVRSFFETVNKQFEDAQFFLHSVRFERDQNTGKLTRVIISYENRYDDGRAENE